MKGVWRSHCLGPPSTDRLILLLQGQPKAAAAAKPDAKGKGAKGPAKGAAKGADGPGPAAGAPGAGPGQVHVDPHMLCVVGQALLCAIEHDFYRTKFPEAADAPFRVSRTI